MGEKKHIKSCLDVALSPTFSFDEQPVAPCDSSFLSSYPKPILTAEPGPHNAFKYDKHPYIHSEVLARRQVVQPRP